MRYSGTVTDRSTGETLPGASVFVSDKSGKMTPAHVGTITDSHGKFSLEANLGPDDYVNFSYIGYRAVLIKPGDSDLDASLDPVSNGLPTVEISGTPIIKNESKSASMPFLMAGILFMIILGTIVVVNKAT